MSHAAAERAKLAERARQLDARESTLADREAELQKQRSEFYALLQREVDRQLGHAGISPSRDIRHVELMCPAFGPTDGYGSSCEQIALALERSGLSISLAGAPRRAGTLNAEHIFTRRPMRGDAIVFYSPPTAWIKQTDRRSFGFTMFEADDIPKDWIPTLTRVDEIWVPSAHSAEIFRRRLTTDKEVVVIPLGVDSAAFAGPQRKRGEKLRILFSATYASEARKGADIAIKAFRAAFPDRDDVELLIRSTFGLQIDRVEAFKGSDARISILVGRQTTRELAEMLWTFDALLYPSRGEGFGLIPLEAMASGMPAIYPDSTGMHEYADLGLTVGTRPIPARIGAGRGNAEILNVDADWHEPNIDDLVDRLRYVDEHYEDAQARAQLDAARIADEWSYDRTAAAMRARFAP